MRLWCVDRNGVRGGGAPPRRQGVGGGGGLSGAARGICWGGASAPGPAPARTAQLPPWPSLLAPCGLFEAETTRGCAEAGCYAEKVGEGVIYGCREAVFTPCLPWKPETKQSGGRSSPSPWGGRQCQVDAPGFIFSDVGRWWELPWRHRVWWVCVRCARMHTCRCVRVYVSSRAGVCWAQHGFGSGHPGSWGEAGVLWS